MATGNNNQYFETDVVSFQVGANASQTITIAFGDFNTSDTKSTFAGAINSSHLESLQLLPQHQRCQSLMLRYRRG